MTEETGVVAQSRAAEPYDWAIAEAQRQAVPKQSAVEGKSALVRALRSTGLLRAAAVLDTGKSTGATSHADLTSCDAALASLLQQHGTPAIPSVTLDLQGAPRFFVTSTNLSSLAEALRTEHGPTGVDAELRLFLDEALVKGDCFVDASPGLGFASLTAATCVEPVPVIAIAPSEEAAGDLQNSARLTGCAEWITVQSSAPLDAVTYPPLASTSYLIVHAGEAHNVAPLLAGAQHVQQRGLIGAVAWSRTSDGAAVAEAVLTVLGFSHFILSEDEDGMQLVPAQPDTMATTIFSMSAAFMERAERVAPVAPAAGDGALQQPSEALFDAITDTLAPGARELGGVPSKGQLALAQLEFAWASAQIVSFDIFDTLLVRKASAATDVFLHLARYEPFRDVPLAPLALSQARQDAEEEARRRGYAEHGSTEVTLRDIHTVLAGMLALPDAAVPRMVDAECTVERALCEGHALLQRWFARAVQDGKTVWCLSDTYHDADFLAELLTHCGYDMRGITVVSSANLRASKSEGTMFRRVLSETGVDPSQILHVGDHPVGDESVPLSFGLVAVAHPWASIRSDDGSADTAADSVALGLAAIGARTLEPPAPFWFRFGFSVAGPLLTGFALWLRERFRADGITRAYFLLRDGEILHAVYEALGAGDPSHDGGPTSSLLESSRRAFVLPAFDARRSTLWSQLTATENARPAREFLSRLGVDANRMASAFPAAGFASWDEMVDPQDRAAMMRVSRLLQQPAVEQALHARSAEERALLMGYLAQEGVLDGGRVALVDIGWNGTIQKSLMAALELEHRSASISGYYLGTLGTAHVEMGGSAMAGYLFEAGRPHARQQTIMQLPQLLEFVCSTTRGSLRAFEQRHGRVEPVHSAVDHDAAQQEAHEQLRDGVLEYAKRFREVATPLETAAISPDAAMKRLARVILSPTAEEAATIGSVRHGEGMATGRARALAEFSPDAWTVQAVHRDLMQSYWPAGLSARRSAQAQILRTLQWLSQGAQE